jgi:hypothetical protein
MSALKDMQRFCRHAGEWVKQAKKTVLNGARPFVRKLLNFTVSHRGAILWGLVLSTIVLDWWTLKGSESASRGYPNTYHGMKWDKSRQEALEKAIDKANAKLLKWARWAIPIWVIGSLLIIACSGIVLGVVESTALSHIMWAAIFGGCRTVFAAVGSLFFLGDLSDLTAFLGLGGFCFFSLIVVAALTQRRLYHEWPSWRTRPHQILVPPFKAVAGVTKPATPVVTWIAFIGGCASMVTAIKGIVELIKMIMPR